MVRDVIGVVYNKILLKNVDNIKKNFIQNVNHMHIYQIQIYVKH